MPSTGSRSRPCTAQTVPPFASVWCTARPSPSDDSSNVVPSSGHLPPSAETRPHAGQRKAARSAPSPFPPPRALGDGQRLCEKPGCLGVRLGVRPPDNGRLRPGGEEVTELGARLVRRNDDDLRPAEPPHEAVEIL